MPRQEREYKEKYKLTKSLFYRRGVARFGGESSIRVRTDVHHARSHGAAYRVRPNQLDPLTRRWRIRLYFEGSGTQHR